MPMPMRIKNLRFKNGYKRFHDLTIDLGEQPKKIVALVGPNGCGKSSVLDGLLFLNNVHGQIGNKNPKDHNYHSLSAQPGFSHGNIEVNFAEGTFQEVRESRRQTGLENTIFSFSSPYRYNSSLKVTQSQATTEIRLNNYGATTTADIDDKMEQNYRRINVLFNRFLKDNPSTATYNSAKAQIIGELNASLRSCLELEIVSIGDIEDGKGTFFFKKDDHPAEFEFDVLSSGEKEVVDILVDLYLRRDSYADSVFLIDEPELHINTSIQRRLLVEINRLIPDNCQLWITTHSIGFLRALQDEVNDDCQIINFPHGTQWASTAQRLVPMNKSIRDWSLIFKTALDDLSGLVSPRTIVYCEGRDQPGYGGSERGFDAKVLNNIFGSKYGTTLFVSSGGNTELDQRSEIAFAILTKVFSDVEILVLKDRDVSSGRANTENDRQVYLDTHPQNFRILKRWEIENYLFDKEVLQSYCMAKGLAFAEEAYDAFIGDIDNQNVKDEVNRMKNFCGITTSINPEQFKISLSSYLESEMSAFKELEACIFSRA
jgi:AAA15 family ATPase/GTPase